MTLTDVANLALSALGEPLLTDYASDTGTTAQACRLHLPIARDTVLEGHVWSFATACSRLTASSVVQTTASATIDPAGADNAITFTAASSGPAGNEITVAIAARQIGTSPEIAVAGNAITITPHFTPATLTTDHEEPDNFADSADSNIVFTQADPDIIPTIAFQGANLEPNEITISVVGNAITITLATNFGAAYTPAAAIIEAINADPAASALVTASPAGTATGLLYMAFTFSATALAGGGAQPTATDIVAAINSDPAASALVTASLPDGTLGTGTLSAVAATALAGGSSTSSIFAPAYGSAYNLPDDCLRVIKIDGTDIDQPLNRWEIQGRHLLLEDENATAPVIHYITNAADPSTWPITFADAVAFLLAHRLAPLLADDQALASAMLNRHMLALGQARSKDARETRSKENFGPRHLAARSGLVMARFSGSGLPPYTAPGGTTTETPIAVADLDGAFESEL